MILLLNVPKTGIDLNFKKRIDLIYIFKDVIPGTPQSSSLR